MSRSSTLGKKTMFKFIRKRKQLADERRKRSEYLESAREAAHRIVATQHEDLRIRSEENDELSVFLADPENHSVLLSLELQYLAGYFEEYAKAYDYPTTPEERALLHIIDWLMHYRKYNLDEARGEAVSLCEMKDEEDKLFQSIKNRGKEAHEGNDRADFFDILRALKTELEPNA